MMWYSCSALRKLYSSFLSFVVSGLLGLSLLVSNHSVALQQHIEVITQNQWPQYVNGTNILALPQASRILALFEENDQASILILYPSTDIGQSWGRSLANWLVSFGIPSTHLQTAPSIDNLNQLVITLTQQD
ncbi:MAG: hypothetical protein GKR95_11185 [Gammaproteobacteria bacterium]|nr:hypothetical protein [Gammaproteobacteria bacterium]